VVGQNVDIRYDASSQDATEGAQLGNDPEYWLQLHTGFDVRARHEIDVWLRHVASLPNPDVPSYTAVDARVGIRVTPSLDFSVTGYNLLDLDHPEWGAAPGRSEIARSVYGELRLRLWRTR
jgi:iron complex outermembrane receptor protein